MAQINYYYNLKFLLKALLGYLAYFAFYPACLPALLNRIRGVKISSVFNVNISPFVTIDTIYPELIRIEEGVTITRGCFIIGHFNPTAMIADIMEIERVKKAVVLKRGAFVGVNSVIMPGVTIGNCALVKPGSVVVADVPDFCIVQGNPAKQVGRLPRAAIARYHEKYDWMHQRRRHWLSGGT